MTWSKVKLTFKTKGIHIGFMYNFCWDAGIYQIEKSLNCVMFSSILNFILFILDKRVADWPLMDGISQTLALSGLYLLIVWLGPIYMQNKKPFTFRWTLVIYNLMLIVLNFHIASEVRLTTELLESLLFLFFFLYIIIIQM